MGRLKAGFLLRGGAACSLFGLAAAVSFALEGGAFLANGLMISDASA